jgi:hypothetical protein
MAERARTWGELMWMLAVASSSVMAASPEGSPQQALVEIALASKPATVEKHLPESLLDDLQRLDPADRALAEEKLLVGRLLGAQEGELVVPDDGSALLVALEQGTEQAKLEIRVEREINSGSDAILELGVRHSGNYAQTVLVWMRLEGTEWRVKQVDLPRFFERVALDDPGFAERFRNVQHRETDAQITAVMYEILRALQQFARAYPDLGFPGDLSVLSSGPEDEEANEEHAGLLRDDIAVNEFAQDGYTFRYELLRGGPQGDFAIIARPGERGKVGARSYLLDASGTMRSTEDDRDPTSQDEPVQ